MKKLPGDFRQLNLTQLSPEVRQLHEGLRAQVDLVREKTQQMKESVIHAAVGPDTPIGPELASRMRWEFHPHGIEKVFLDDQLLVVFQPGYLNLESGQWTIPYAVTGARP